MYTHAVSMLVLLSALLSPTVSIHPIISVLIVQCLPNNWNLIKFVRVMCLITAFWHPQKLEWLTKTVLETQVKRGHIIHWWLYVSGHLLLMICGRRIHSVFGLKLKNSTKRVLFLKNMKMKNRGKNRKTFPNVIHIYILSICQCTS